MDRDIIDRLLDFDSSTAGERVNLRESAAVVIHGLRQEIVKLHKQLNWAQGEIDRLLAKKSAPEQSATQNTAEGLPPETAQCAGADTFSDPRDPCECGKGGDCSRPHECWAYRSEQQAANLGPLIGKARTITVSPERQAEIQAPDPNMPPIERLKKAVEIARKPTT